MKDRLYPLANLGVALHPPGGAGREHPRYNLNPNGASNNGCMQTHNIGTVHKSLWWIFEGRSPKHAYICIYIDFSPQVAT